MKRIYLILIIAAVIVSITIGGCSETTEQQSKESAKPEYSANVPESITTPDKVQTQLLGELEFLCLQNLIQKICYLQQSNLYLQF
jgi:hypothetical protein